MTLLDAPFVALRNDRAALDKVLWSVAEDASVNYAEAYRLLHDADGALRCAGTVAQVLDQAGIEPANAPSTSRTLKMLDSGPPVARAASTVPKSSMGRPALKEFHRFLLGIKNPSAAVR